MAFVRHPLSVAASLVAVGLVVVSATPVPAQHYTRDLTGTVMDKQHEPLRGAVVEVFSAETGNVVSYITNQTGGYNFKRLDGDLDYTLWATWQGRRSAVKKLSHFDNDTGKNVDLEIANSYRDRSRLFLTLPPP